MRARANAKTRLGCFVAEGKLTGPRFAPRSLAVIGPLRGRGPRLLSPAFLFCPFFFGKISIAVARVTATGLFLGSSPAATSCTLHRGKACTHIYPRKHFAHGKTKALSIYALASHPAGVPKKQFPPAPPGKQLKVAGASQWPSLFLTLMIKRWKKN